MLVIADYSEFQGVVHPPAGQPVIIRAHNGWRPDNDFAANRAAAHAAGSPAVGLYQYLVAGRDAAAQAVDLLRLVGRLGDNEWLICDLEEGVGDQQARWQAWRTPILQATGRPPWLYSGASFAATHDLDPDWVAAYGQGEPVVAHKLWQNSDVYPWPWGKGDGSVFGGTLPEFLAAVGISLPGPVTPAPLPVKQGDNMVLTDPTTGGVWVADDKGAVFGYDGAPYLGGTNTRGLPWPCVGIGAFHDKDGDGYVLVLDTGDPNRPEGRYARYRYPRSGAAKG